MSVPHITRGPDVRTPLGEFETRWCFKCRKRTEHEWIKWSESRADSPYELNFSLTCPSCNEEHINFPGCGPV